MDNVFRLCPLCRKDHRAGPLYRHVVTGLIHNAVTVQLPAGKDHIGVCVGRFAAGSHRHIGLPDGVLVGICGCRARDTALRRIGIIDHSGVGLVPGAVNADHIDHLFFAVALTQLRHTVFAVHRHIPVKLLEWTCAVLLPYPTLRIYGHRRVLHQLAVVKIMGLEGFRGRAILVVFHDVVGYLLPLGDEDHGVVLAVADGDHRFPVLRFQHEAVGIQPADKLIALAAQKRMLLVVGLAQLIFADALAVGHVFILDHLVGAVSVAVVTEVELNVHMQTVIAENVGLGEGFDVFHTVEFFVMRPVGFVKQRIHGGIADFGIGDCNRIVALIVRDRIGGVVLVGTAVGSRHVDTGAAAVQTLDGEAAGVLDHLAQLGVHLIAHATNGEIGGLALQTLHGIHQGNILLILKLGGQRACCHSSAASFEEVGRQILPSGGEHRAALHRVLVVGRVSGRQPAGADRIDLKDSLTVLHIVQRVGVVAAAGAGCRVAPADVLGGNTVGTDVLTCGGGFRPVVDHRAGDEPALLQLIHVHIAAGGVAIGDGEYDVVAHAHIVEVDDGISGAADRSRAVRHFAAGVDIVPVHLIGPSRPGVVIDEIGGIHIVQRCLLPKHRILVYGVFLPIHHADHLVRACPVIAGAAVGGFHADP